MVGICLLSFILMILAINYPIDLHFMGAVPYAPVGHMILEIFSIVVGALIITIAWQTLDRSRKNSSNLLVLGFTVVVGSDFLHVLSYQGMPDFLSPSSPSKAIFFWLVGRYAELFVLIGAALHISLPGPRLRWFLLGLLIFAVVLQVGMFHLDMLPATFVPGVGVTPFKASLEYLLFAGYLAVALWIFIRHRRTGLSRGLDFAVASFIMGVAELAFSNYTTPSDFINIVGHFYKVVAYGFMFRAAFMTGMRMPYEKLEESEAQLHAKRKELEALLDNIPLSVTRIDRDLRYKYVNRLYEQRVGEGRADIIGRQMGGWNQFQNLDDNNARIMAALAGQKSEFDFDFINDKGEHVYRSAIMVPERDDDGHVRGVLTIIADITERVKAQNQLLQSQSEMIGLKAALDAHAIVATVDAQGILVEVNDKFCEQSQYSREELIGQHSDIIASGYHPESFMHEIWDTVLRGDIWSGEICSRAKDGTIYWVYSTTVPVVDAAGQVTQFIAINADITKRKRAEQEVEHMAFHDALTGLPNRRLMRDRLGHAVLRAARNRSYGAVLLLDIDYFKEINDTLGHALGDALLQEMTGRLCDSLRSCDTVARLGGDEFVIILEDIGDNAEDATSHADSVCEKIRETMNAPCRLGEDEVSATLSIGVVLFHVAQDHPDELLKQADIALYKAKEEGRNRVRYFDPSLQADVTARAALLRDLRQALGQDQLCLHYQPIVDADRRILGVEALLRWQHPSRGLVSPDIFIPIAEQSNLIAPIGQWVLESACAQLRQWADDPGRADWTIAVNVSARQFNEPEFVANVERALAKTGANPSLLCLELTESILHNDLGVTQSKMATLRDRGVRFSLDDFGTGYSSLSYLQQLPLDQLKIDRSFIHGALSDPNSAEIVAIILSLARNLDLRVVAEGVDTAAQFDFLCGHHCHAFQGYLFSRPVPVADLLQQG